MNVSFTLGYSYDGYDFSGNTGFGSLNPWEDIPIIIINWKITDKWSLDNGRGLDATLGPGLTLNYQPNRMWLFGIGGRYEKLRFRLDKNGATGDGVGEDSSFPIFVSSTYNVNPKSNISLVRKHLKFLFIDKI